MERGQECYRTWNWEMLQVKFKLALTICALITRPQLRRAPLFKLCFSHRCAVQYKTRTSRWSKTTAPVWKPCSTSEALRSSRTGTVSRLQRPAIRKENLWPHWRKPKEGWETSQLFYNTLLLMITPPRLSSHVVFLIIVLRHAIKELNAIPIILQL